MKMSSYKESFHDFVSSKAKIQLIQPRDTVSRSSQIFSETLIFEKKKPFATTYLFI